MKKILSLAGWFIFMAACLFWVDGIDPHGVINDRVVNPQHYALLSVVMFNIAIFCLALLPRAYRIQDEQKKTVVYTKEQLEELERDRIRAAEERALQVLVDKEVNELKKRIPWFLHVQPSQFGIASFHPEGKSRTRARKRISAIKFEWIGMSRTNVYFKLDMMALLRAGMRASDLKKETNYVIENLQHGINRPCTFYEDDYFNLYVRVFLKTGIQGIPKVFLWEDAFDALPKGRKFAVPVGVNEYNKVYYQDLTAWPHGLILGATGTGKSTFIKHSIITLGLRNKPHELELWLVDLKRVEFGMFADLPHVKRFINRVDEFSGLMDDLIKEMDRRFNKFEGICSELYEWNIARPGEQMPVIMCWMDELALVTRGGNPELAKDAITKILKLVALGRAVGIHLIMGTQTISKEVLPMDITANVDGRVCFGVPNSSASTLAIGDARAVNLKPVGRCVYKKESDLLFLQTPIMHPDKVLTRKMLLEQIERIKENCKPENQDFDELQLFKIALTMKTAAYQSLSRHPGIPWSEIEIRKVLERWESNGDVKPIEIDGNKMVLANYGRGAGNGRKLVPLDEYMESDIYKNHLEHTEKELDKVTL